MSGTCGGVVIFDYTIWASKYTILAASVTETVAQLWFDEAATLYLNNTACSPVQDLPTRAMILGMLTAHLVILNVPIGNANPSPLVGRISNGTQGSVSVAVENQYPPGTVQWYQQTQPGASAWAALAPYRTARYLPAPRRFRGLGGRW